MNGNIFKIAVDKGYKKSNITNESLIDWIFKLVINNQPEKEQQKALFKNNLKWLHFWYTTLLEHKFSLMYEFIGRLEEWFEYNEYYILPFRIKDGWQVNIDYFQNDSEEMLTDDNIKDYFDTKLQAKHEAIMKCFELIKNK